MADRITDSLAKSAKPEHLGRVLGLFAKVWDPGCVKTRLAKTLGIDKAAQIYLELLVLHLQRFAHSTDRRIVVYSPATEGSETRFEELVHSLYLRGLWDFVPQVESDLGTRMSRFFQQQFDALGDSARIAVIGSDAPRLTRELVDEAFELLEGHDVVFGPSTDGGYYLVGLSTMAEGIFQGVDWSTEHVLEQSLAKCEEAGLSAALLPSLTDIDNEEDLVHEIQELEKSDDLLVGYFRNKVVSLMQRIES